MNLSNMVKCINLHILLLKTNKIVDLDAELDVMTD